MDFECPITPFETALMTPQITDTQIINQTNVDESWPILQSVSDSTNDEQRVKQESVMNIRENLKLSCSSQSRQPTQSPFFRNSTQGINKSTLPNTSLAQTIQPDRTETSVPTTAEVLNDIDSLRQKSLEVKAEFISTIADNKFPEASQNDPMVTSVSPKKRFIIRSQSQTDSTASNVAAVNNIDQAQRLVTESNNFSVIPNDDIQDGNLRFDPISSSIVKEENHTGFHTHIEDRHFNLPRNIPESNPVHSTRNANYSHSNKTKRSNEFASTGQKLVKIPQLQSPKGSVIFNEVSSSTPLQERKRLKIMASTMNGYEPPAKIEANGLRSSADGDEHRRKLIRDSNREAARRCRERRRQYIEHLENDLDKLKVEIQRFQEKLGQLERENVQLRTIIAEGNIFPNRRTIPVESTMDFQSVNNVNGATDSMVTQRNFNNRNHH